jgi:23S rRNA (pseudouridine1915-N3)-methyltransferase
LEQALAAMPGGAKAYHVALDIGGKPFSSAELALWLANCGNMGRNPLVFWIGGPSGLHDSLLGQANLRLSLGPLTLPHNLARIVLLEQVYRAYRINRCEPYHR